MHRRRINRSNVLGDEFERREQFAALRNENRRDSNSTIKNDIRPSVYDRYKAFMSRLYWVKYVFCILIAPSILNLIALHKESVALFPEQGEQLEMGWGQKMFIKCIGDGLPTVILDAPTGGTSDLWFVIQKQLSKVTQVCSYDRAGLGFSNIPFLPDKNQKPKWEKREMVSPVATLEQMTCDLHCLVTNAKPLKRPFILVGSEIGGLIARYYSMKYPDDVSDVLLLNPLVEDLFWRQKEDWINFWNSQMLPSLESLHLAAYIGMSRVAILIGWLKPEISGTANGLPKEIELAQVSHLCNPSHMGAVFHEHLLLNESFSQMSEMWKSKSFPKNISVTVINSRKFEKVPLQLQKAWQQSQLYLRQSLHPSCKHYMYDGTAGELFRDPGIIISKVQQLIYQWRLKNDFIPTVYTFREKEIISE